MNLLPNNASRWVATWRELGVDDSPAVSGLHGDLLPQNMPKQCRLTAPQPALLTFDTGAVVVPPSKTDHARPPLKGDRRD
jgi:hypothetical protein